MYVEKFSGESIDEVLKHVKKKLGPDAIILKTSTNKGIKGAFKKGRIEITAAVKERDYEKKARVDQVFTNDQKEEFYQASASSLANSIESYNASPAAASGYGRMGLNKMVNTVTKTAQNAGEAIKSGLDEFLSAVPYDTEEEYVDSETHLLTPKITPRVQEQRPEPLITETHIPAAAEPVQDERVTELESKIRELENLVLTMGEQLSEKEEPLQENKEDVYEEVKTVLSGVGLNSGIIKEVLKSVAFTLNEDEKRDFDTVFEYILKYLDDNIQTKMPLFSNSEMADKNTITVLYSSGSCGQTSMAIKMASLCENTLLLTYGSNEGSKNFELSKHLHNIECKTIHNASEIYFECRKAVAEGRKVVLDYRSKPNELDEAKQLAHGLERSFDNVEVLVALSAIHAEDYNRKIISKYKEFSDGVIISHVDQCLNFGALVNLNFNCNLPFVFYGTGECVPTDVEAASSERMIAGMFKF
jgi:flagellar biosynthesis protein FlhF